MLVNVQVTEVTPLSVGLRKDIVMGCCGKLKNIAIGHMKHFLYKNEDFAFNRIQYCLSCLANTWFSKREYLSWLLKYNIQVLINLAQLDKLPRLPKQEKSLTRNQLCCSICKCPISHKVLVKNEKCPKGFW